MSQPRLLDLSAIQQTMGGVFADGSSYPLSFGNEAEVWSALDTGVVLYDRSHWGQLLIAGADRLRYLHNQSTNDIQALKPGQACDTVFVTSTGRTIDLVTAYALDEAVLLLTSPACRHSLMQWIDLYIFPADQVTVTDQTDHQAAFSLIGPHSTTLLTSLGVNLPNLPLGNGEHQQVSLEGLSCRIASGSGLATPGYTILVDRPQAASLWQRLHQARAIPMGDQAWQQVRIKQGRPMPGSELTPDYNPLEAGLWHTISFSKGCYIGQETIARLNTYNGVKQKLWGIRLQAAATVGSLVMNAEEKVGRLTSVANTPDGWLGLAYVRTKSGGEGLSVQVDGVDGTISDVPFLTRSPA